MPKQAMQNYHKPHTQAIRKLHHSSVNRDIIVMCTNKDFIDPLLQYITTTVNEKQGELKATAEPAERVSKRAK
jgi:hypothetical protein